MESFSFPKRRVWVYEGVVFFENTFVNIFDFVNKSQSLIRSKWSEEESVLLIQQSFHSYIKVLLHL